MKYNIKTIALAGCVAVAMSSCSDYLNTSSPSTITEQSAMSSLDNSRSVMDGTYTKLHDVMVSHIFGNGMFYTLDVAGSDIERHGGERNVERINAETFYKGGDSNILGNYSSVGQFKEAPNNAYAQLFAVIASCNDLLSGINEVRLDDVKEGAAFKQIYGEAVCMRATCYRELIKYYGDVPAVFDKKSDPTKLVSRLDIYDKVISDLKNVTDNGYLADVTGASKNKFSKQYAYALLGRIAMERAGYHTFRLDVTAADRLEKHPDYTDNNNATYARATDYKQYYETAYNAFKAVAEHMAAVGFNETDYSEFFTQIHGEDYVYATESIFEDEQVQGASGNCERPYSIGRPSSGGSSKAYPCKSYAQCHINPAFYYGVFDPRDVRRDISCVVTGSDGKGYETVVPFDIATTSKGGGISCGKFDENRQKTIWTANQRRSGINNPYMRMSEVYLGLAECCVVLGKSNDEALGNFNKTYKRAMNEAYAGTLDLEKVIDERGFEFAGEGDRRWTLIRTGLIGKKVAAIKDLTKEMMKGLNANGCYTFANGNTISDYIYVKQVNPKELGLDSRITPATPAAMRVAGYEPTTDAEAVQFPGWRGQHDWENVAGFTAYNSNAKSNTAIRGLFTRLTEAPEGYTKVAWGAKLVESENMENFYNSELFEGWDYKTAPVYMIPFTTNDRIGGLTNGYGFGNN